MEIYGLFDDSGELRYVGKTEQTLAKRLKEHVAPWHLIAATHKNSWIKQLLRYGLNPRIQTIQTLPKETVQSDLNKAEIYWIKFFKDQGCRLTNGTDGGEGLAGRKHSEATKAKMSAATKGRTQSPAHLAALSAVRTGRVQSDETKAKISAAHKGKTMSQETRARMSAAKTPELRARVSAALLGKPKTRRGLI